MQLIAGLEFLGARPFQDSRGMFKKVAHNLPFHVEEVFWSCSEQGVIRGMHVQRPQRSCRKLIFVVDGEIRDVVVDLRAESPTLGEVNIFPLRPADKSIVVPSGCAHGFEVVRGPCRVVYLQEERYVMADDLGFRWDSHTIEWLTSEPVISARDASLPSFSNLVARF